MRIATKLANRRKVLKGILGSAVVTVALPMLDCFLTSNGNALAATGSEIPVRFGTWYWGCGLRPGRWEPVKPGAGYEMREHLRSLAPFKDRINILSGLDVSLDGNPARVHWSGTRACSAGEVLDNAPSIDTIISGLIGNSTRFRSLEASTSEAKGAAANTVNSISRINSALINPPEASPTALYTRIFGPEFHDPNAAEFRPNPNLMVKKSVLSAIKEDADALKRQIGANDRQRLDEYFTSVREIERQVDLQLVKPAPLPSCTMPTQPHETPEGTEVDTVSTNHALLINLLVHAFACDQTRVLNMYFTGGELHKSGDPTTHHTNTHEEPIDERAGYQVKVAWYEEYIMDNFAALLKALDGVKEGDKTLLDRTLIYAFSDHGLAQSHGLQNIPIILAGGAGGRMKGGNHIAFRGEPVTRAGLTIQRIMGVNAESWGTGSMKTSDSISEIVA